MVKGEKYSIKDLEGLPNNDVRLIKVGLMIANELHNIYSVLWEKKRGL